MKNITHLIVSVIVTNLIFQANLFAQKPYRVGTTTANFLEVGIGGAGVAMGDAYVSAVRDLSAIYWNPAGLAYMERHEAQFSLQPWIVDINTSFTAVGLVLPRIGTLGFGLLQTSYGEMKVTTIDMIGGTGEKFDASDIAFSFSFGRKLAQWFAFGVSAKYISSRIWHSSGKALAVDLGVLVNTHFFSLSGQREHGLTIGMSISNYGTRLKFDGMDIKEKIDIAPYEVGGFREEGNFRDVPAKFDLQAWELPLIFRVGFTINPVVTENHHLMLSVDALHPNNNAESVNAGAQYALVLPGIGDFYLRGGYKALFLEYSEFGATFGGGFVYRVNPRFSLKLDYAYRPVGILGYAQCYNFCIMF